MEKMKKKCDTDKNNIRNAKYQEIAVLILISNKHNVDYFKNSTIIISI